MLKKLDQYIVQKYLTTFFFTVLIFTLIAVIIDFSEKIEEFIDKDVPVKEIIFEYYLNWILWINGLLFPMYSMIAVIFFTSRMAYNSEIIAILNAGVSFRRLIKSYLIAGIFIFILHLLGNHYFIPLGNKIHYDFQHKYVWQENDEGKKKYVHFFVEPQKKVYVNYYSAKKDTVIKNLRIEGIESNSIAYIMKISEAQWIGRPNKWSFKDFELRTFSEGKETISFGEKLDTVLNLTPEDFVEYKNQKDMMDTPELQQYIANEKRRGVANVKKYEVEVHRRTAEPFTIIILTLIGVSVASRKMRGGMGFHLAIGIALGAIYVFLSKFSITFAVSQLIPPILGVWIPNILFAGIAVYLIAKAQK